MKNVKWIIGGILLIGAGVGAYFVFKKPTNETTTPADGTPKELPTVVSPIDDRIDTVDTVVKETSKSTPTPTKLTKEKPVVRNNSSTSPTVNQPYDVTTDKDYDAKMTVLSALHYKVTNGGRGDTPSSTFAAWFLPMSLADIKIYSNSILASDKNSPLNLGKRANLQKKYPTLFSKINGFFNTAGRGKGFDGSSSFSGNAELSNCNLLNI